MNTNNFIKRAFGYIKMRFFLPAAIFIAIFSVLLILFFGLEVYCRWKTFHSYRLPPRVFIEDRTLGYKYNPKNPNTPHGFRGGIVSEKRPEGLVRIICVGESVTAGYMNESDEAWPAYLQEYLDMKSGEHRYDVINAAVGGYGTKHIILQVRHFLGRYEPDIILVYAGWLGRGLISSDYTWTPVNVIAPQSNLLERTDKFLMNHCYIYLSRIRWRLEKYLKAHKSAPKDESIQKDSEDNRHIRKDFQQLIQEIRAIGAVPVIIIFPCWEEKIVEKGEEYSQKIFERRSDMGEVARENNVCLINMSAVFSDIPDKKKGGYYFDFMHLTERGADIFSQMLADSIMTFFP